MCGINPQAYLADVLNRIADTRSAKSTPCSSGAGQNCACHVAFQPPDFYTKRGYGVFGRLDDYPPGHAKLFLYKRLSVPPG